MRVRNTTHGLTVQATAGSHVVILGMDMAKEDCDGLLGFAVHRTDPTESTAKWMEGLKCFEDTDPGFVPGAKYATNEHPIQGFSWSDFTAKPGRQYTYRVQALGGTPEALSVQKETEVVVDTEAPGGGAHEAESSSMATPIHPMIMAASSRATKIGKPPSMPAFRASAPSA